MEPEHRVDSKLQAFLDHAEDIAGECYYELGKLAMGRPLRVDSLNPEIRDLVRKEPASASREPNDYALEQLAKMVVTDSGLLRERGWRADTGETMLFATMLKHVVARYVPTLYTPNQVRGAFPIDNSVPPGARTYAHRRLEDKDDDDFGAIAEKADDVRMVEVQGEEDVRRIQSFARGVSWSVEELEAAAFANVPLTTEYLAALNRTVERIFELVALRGYAAKAIVGAYNDPAITITPVVTGTWATATHDQIVGDVRALYEAIRIASGDNYPPSRLLLPSSLWRYLSVRRANSDLNVRTALLQDYPGLDIIMMTRASLYDAGGTGPRIMMFTPSADLAKVVEAQRFTLQPPEKDGFVYRVIGKQRLGGFACSVPLSAGYMDGC